MIPANEIPRMLMQSIGLENLILHWLELKRTRRRFIDYHLNGRIILVRRAEAQRMAAELIDAWEPT